MTHRPYLFLAILASLAASLGAVPAAAHHSYAAFDRQHKITIEGDIMEIDWSNPHVALVVSQAGAEPYRIEWNSIHRMKKAGVEKDMLKVGDHVFITGAPNKHKETRVISLLDEIRRPADGWTWSRPGKGSGSVSIGQQAARE